MNVNKCTAAGGTFIFWVADWFALMNHKLGGDLKKIQTVGRYMVEVWKAIGMDMEKVQFISSSEEINKHAAEYWPLVLDIATKNNLKRIIRCSQIMGRDDTAELSAAQIFYPYVPPAPARQGGRRPGAPPTADPLPARARPPGACSARTSSSSRRTSASSGWTSAR